MKTFLTLLLLGVVIYFMYRRANDFGYPWEDQIVLRGVESVNQRWGGSPQLHVRGEVKNMTRKRMQAEIECKTVPSGMTLSPKSTTTVDLQPEEALPFDMRVKSNQNTTGAECKVKDWTAGSTLEEKTLRSVRRLFNRLRASF